MFGIVVDEGEGLGFHGLVVVIILSISTLGFTLLREVGGDGGVFCALLLLLLDIFFYVGGSGCC